jgi:hypothetical protein
MVQGMNTRGSYIRYVRDVDEKTGDITNGKTPATPNQAAVLSPRILKAHLIILLVLK